MRTFSAPKTRIYRFKIGHFYVSERCKPYATLDRSVKQNHAPRSERHDGVRMLLMFYTAAYGIILKLTKMVRNIKYAIKEAIEKFGEKKQQNEHFGVTLRENKIVFSILLISL